jgi:hypothetical protein
MARKASARESVVMARFVRSYWILGKIFRRDAGDFTLRLFPLIGLHALFPILALIAGDYDNSMFLPGAGRGVVEHYGFHALFLSAPVLLYLTCRILKALAKIISDPLPWLSPNASAALVSLQRSLQDFAMCRLDKYKGLLLLMRTVGVFAVVANAASTRYPVTIYGQDVFDSSRHALGYLTGRVFLAYYWIYLLPLIAYFALVAMYVAIRIASFVDQLPEYEIRCFASDGCGGFRALGRLMTLVVYLWVPIVFIVIALLETHTNFYATLKLGAGLAIIIPAQLFLPFVRLHDVLKRLKERKLAALERFLTSTEQIITVKRKSRDDIDNSTSDRSTMPYLRMLAGETIYRQTAAMSTWPYLKTDFLRWVMPFVPLALSVTLKQLGL